jgi:hypothetical protein
VCVLAGALSVQAEVELAGDLTAHMDSIIAEIPTTYGGGDYLQPNAASRTLWREIIDHILATEYDQAHTKALTKNYRVVRFTDTADPDSVVHIILERTPESSSRYWGTFVFNTAPRRSYLAIQSPHPRYDTNTGRQSVRIYLHTEARALFISGTHRCNGLSDSPCDGTTTICTGSSAPYRYSDQCHVVKSTFQITNEAMLDDNPDLLAIQPHGFGQGAGDPDVIISNGTRFYPSGTDYAVAVWDALHDVDPSLTAKIAHIDLDWTRLIATWNTQGRLMNGSPTPCYTPASSATGQFVSVEQKKIGMRDTPQNWMKLAQAIADAVPEDTTAGVTDVPVRGGRIVGSYPNPFNRKTRIVMDLGGPGEIRLDVFDVAGRRVETLTKGPHGAGLFRKVWSAEEVPPGVYFIRLQQQGTTVDIHKCILQR